MLERMGQEEKDARTRYWVMVLVYTYMAIVAIGTLVMHVGSKVISRRRVRLVNPAGDRYVISYVLFVCP